MIPIHELLWFALAAFVMATFITNNPLWISVQKWFMASVLTFLTVKMILSKAK